MINYKLVKPAKYNKEYVLNLVTKKCSCTYYAASYDKISAVCNNKQLCFQL